MSTPVNKMSLYIPHIFANYGEDDVAKIFEELNIGKVKNIDFIPKMGKDGKAFNAAYIHFEYWFANPTAANFQERVLDPTKEARLVYDEPWYWIVLENKGQKHLSGERKPRIDLGPVRINLQQLFVDAAAKDQQEMGEISALLDHEGEIEYDVDQQRMDELSDSMDNDDQFLVSIDSRYVQTIEQENANMRVELDQLRSAVQQRDGYIAANLQQWAVAHQAQQYQMPNVQYTYEQAV